MSYLSINGETISQARLTFPLTGAWHADLFVGTSTNLTGAVSLSIADALTLAGTVIAGGVYAESLRLRVLAGKGGWIAPLVPKFYRGTTLGTILADLLQQGGESLAATSAASVRGINVTAWSSTAATLGANVANLMALAPPDASWRFLPAGTFWVGFETWPAFDQAYTVTNEEPRERRIDLGFEVPTVIAGQSVQASTGTVNLNRVETAISADQMSARAWLQ